MNSKLLDDLRLKVLQCIAGTKLETNKLDFKSKWYDLKEEKGKNEFFKDIAAIANSYGAEDGFIVIGVNENDATLLDTSIEESKLNDVAKIKDLVISNIDKPFLIDIDYLPVNEKQLTVIHIPPSLDKPHLLYKYTSPKNHESKNVIFIRSGTGTKVASKSDIDLMYWEKKNFVIDRKIEVSFNIKGLKFHSHGNQFRLKGKIFIENVGTRNLSILALQLTVSFNQLGNLGKLTLAATGFMVGSGWETLKGQSIQLQPNEIDERYYEFNAIVNVNEMDLDKVITHLNFPNNLSGLRFDLFKATLSSGEEITTVPTYSSVD